MKSVEQSIWRKMSYSDMSLVPVVRKHPTVAVGRALFQAPIITASWQIQANTAKDRALCEALRTFHDDVVLHMARSCYDYGSAFWEIQPDYKEGGIWIPKLKRLSYKQSTLDTDLILRNGDAELSPGEYAVCTLNADVDSPYGEGILPNAFIAYAAYLEAEAAYGRYVKRAAGTHWVIKYPVGKTRFNGVMTDNLTIAQTIFGEMTSSSRAFIPIDPDIAGQRAVKRVDNSTDGAWSMELMTDHGNVGETFRDRLRSCDTQLIRASLLPERSATEGSQGSRSDASQAGDMAMLIIEQSAIDMMNSFNGSMGLLNAVYMMNDRDMRGNAKLSTSPISRSDLTFARNLLTTVLQQTSDPWTVVDSNRIADAADVSFVRDKPEPSATDGKTNGKANEGTAQLPGAMRNEVPPTELQDRAPRGEAK